MCLSRKTSGAHNFDLDFNPLRESLRGRWLSVCNARLRGSDGYYVRDGHQRMSVAWALGQDYVEAIVMA